MSYPTHMELDGKGAFLVRLQCADYGNKVVYRKVWIEHDGIERRIGEHYVELNAMLTTAGHAKPDYGHSKIIAMPRIPVLLEAHSNSYRVAAITDAKGKPIVTREQVVAARRTVTVKPFVFSLYQGDKAVNDWLILAGYDVKPVLKGQYERNKSVLNKFSRPDGKMMIPAKSILKPKGQPFTSTLATTTAAPAA